MPTINNRFENLTLERLQEIYDIVSIPVSTGLTVGVTTITGGTVGRVLFQGAGDVLQESSNLFWDNTNIRLGVGVTPTRTLHVQHIGTTGVTGSLLFYNQDNSYSGLSVLSNGVGFSLNAHTNGTGYISATSSLNFTSYNGTNPAVLWMGNGSRFRFTNTAETSTYLLIANSGNVLVNTTTDAGYKLDVNGVARISGDTTFGGAIRTPNIANLNMIVGNFALQLSSTNPQNTSGSLITTGDITRTDSGTKNIINVNNLVSSTAASFNVLNGYAFTSNITQTQGTIRGLFIAPTLTASTDFRAIETTAGNVIFGASGTGFFWNNSNNRLGIGTSSPSGALHVIGGGIFSSSMNISGGFVMTEAGNVHMFTAPVTNRTIRFITNSQSFSLAPTGNVQIGTTTDAGYKLDVNGTGRIVTSLIIGDTGNPSGSLIVGRTISIGYIATVGANQSFRLGGAGATINTNSFLMSSGGYNNQLGNIGVVRYVVGAAPTSVGANSVTNLYIIGTEAIKLNDGTSSGINSFYNAGIVTVDLSVMEGSTSGNSNVYVGKFAFRFKRYLINGVGTFTDISAVTNLYNSADATLVGTTLTAVANGTDALDLSVTLPATANTAAYRMGANVTITKVNNS